MASSVSTLNEFNDEYTTKIRERLRVFHQNLDLGKWDVIEHGLAPDYYWNYDGSVLFGPTASRAALQYVAGTMLGGVHAQDIYNIVDGNRGAVLFRIAGKQGSDFFDVPLQSSGLYDVRSAEKFVFNDDGLARAVTTVTPIGIMKKQMRGTSTLPPSVEVSLKQSKATTASFRELIRQNMASLHLSILAGKGRDNEALAEEDVENDDNGTVTTGRENFARLVAAENVGMGSFPTKAFHDVDILADGNFGAIEYIWAGTQQSDYRRIPTKVNAKVNSRGFLFFEFSEAGLVKKAISVYDEEVIFNTLSQPGLYSYP